MSAATPSQQGSAHRQGWYMQKYSERQREWADLYFFTEHEWRPLDFEIPNFWCSHRHPLFCKARSCLESLGARAPTAWNMFNCRLARMQEVVVALQTEGGRKTLTGRRLRVYEAGIAREEEIREDQELVDALASHFGLQF